MKIRSGVVALATFAVLSAGAGSITAVAGPPGGSSVTSGKTAPSNGDDADQITANYDQKAQRVQEKAEERITQEDRDAAAARALQDGALNPLMVVDAEMTAMAAVPGEAPRYFSHPNYANSPLPEVTTTPGAQTTVGNELVDRQYATDTAETVFVVLGDALPDGLLTGFTVWNQANADAALASAGKSFHAYVLRPTRFTDQYSVVFDSGQLSMPALTDPAVGEVATFGVANLAVQAGDRLAFYGQGIPLDVTGTDAVYHPSPLSPLQGEVLTLPSTDFPSYPARTYSFAATLTGADQVEIVPGTGIRKFVDELPTITPAVPDTTAYEGADFYRIGLVEYTQRLHSDLPVTGTKLRGYVQVDADGTPVGEP
ncbi:MULTISPECIES: hypothetical protein, partial [unclassified Ornithinimicrobium]|uniref:hypothetical protein n=1 Tax=unclassified Ornithinimicrobium TaxID=2615080 RepID=UPI003851E657